MTDYRWDLITMGRVSMDLFAQDVGVPFSEVTGFDTSVGGCPVNIAIGASRLGLRSATLTAVGEDLVGDFVLRYLQDQQVATEFIPRKPNARTAVAMVAIQPPSTFPLVFYRDNPADIYLTVDDVLALPLASTRAVMLSGTALSRGTCRDAVLFAAEQARTSGVITFMDLDLRPDQWSNPRAFGLSIRAILSRLNVIIGTEEEFHAALADDPTQVMMGNVISDAERDALDDHLNGLLATVQSPPVLVVKQGARGATIHCNDESVIEVPGFPVEILNTVGAGDAFASGLLYGYLKGWDWYRCGRMGNACGALVVTRHGCSEALPREEEVLAFIEARGGF